MKNTKPKFGAYIKEKRLRQEITLREFCRALGIDASNWSKVERGLLQPPKDNDLLTKISKLLELRDFENTKMRNMAMTERFDPKPEPEITTRTGVTIYPQ
jgi:transcriptional regulator with XRE-family HTH domain